MVEERLAPSVKGRVRLYRTRYHKSPTREAVASIFIDGKDLLDMSYLIYCKENYYAKLVGEGNTSIYSILPDENVYGPNYFEGSLSNYLNLSIDRIISSDEPIIRAIGMLDSRLGKKRLKQFDVSSENELVRRMWRLRCESEGLSGSEDKGTPGNSLTKKISTDRYSREYMASRKVLDKVSHSPASE